MERKDETPEQEEQARGRQMPGKRGDFEASQRLTQRLYACYSESQILIPNELLTSVRNTVEDIDRREEIKRRNRERKTKLAATMRTALQDSISSPNYASMATLPANLTVTDMRDLSATGTGLPPLAKLGMPQYMATTKAKDRPAIQMKAKGAMAAMTPVEIRAKGEKELSRQRSPQHAKPIREKGRLKPLKKPKYKRTGKRDDISSHIEIIRYIEDSKGEEQSSYYYCLRGRLFYEFFECNFEDITKESDDYITISARGVTHFVNKEAEFLSLTEWKDEVENYQKINQISFFKNFRIGKSFTLWKRLVKRTKMIERGSYLSKELFQADGQINKQLIKLRQLLHNLHSRDILLLTQDQPQGLEKLSTNIREDQDKLRSQLQKMENGIKDLIFMACEGKIQEFNQNTRIFGKEETKKTENKEDLPYHIFADDTYHPMPFTVEASTKTLYKRLARFIRMVDYMLMQLKINVIRNSYNKLLNMLSQQNSVLKRIMPIFKVSARFAGEELAFSPTVAEVKEMLSQRLSDGIRMICSRPMLADEEKFKIYMSTLEEGDEKEEGRINPLKMVEESEDIRMKKKEIEEVLDVAFRQLDVYKKDLVPFIAIFQKHCELKFDQLEGQPDTMYRIWVEQFEKDKIHVSDKLEETKVLGIITVDSSEMKNTIMKKPKDSRDNMEKIIPTHSSIIIRSLMEKMKIIEDGILSTKTWTIDEYVKYRKFLEEHRKNSDMYDEQLSKGKSLHAIMSEFQMRLSNKGKKELETLESKWKSVKAKLKESFEKCEAAEGAQKAALIAKGQEMNNTLKSLINELDADKFYKKTESPATIVEDLANIEVKIQNAEEACRKIEENELYLQTPKDDFEDKKRLKSKHEHLKKFWNDQAFWHEKKVEWCQTQIKAVDTEALSKRITEMREVAKNAELILRTELEKDFIIAKEFQDEELDPMLSAIEVIKNVLKDTVQEWHWKMIMEMLACNMKRDDPELNLKALMTLIKDAKKKWKEEHKSEAKIEEWITGIVDQAMHEFQLSKDFDKIKQKWEGLHPTTRQAPGSRIFLEEPDRLLEIINDCMANLQKILSNEYAAPLRDSAEQLYKKISKFEEIIEELLIVEKKIRLIDELMNKEEFKAQSFGTKYDEVQKLWKRYLTIKRQGVGEGNRDSLVQKFLSTEEHYLALYQDLGKRVDDIINDIELKAEEKQIDCPRLLFLSNKEYIRILCDWKKLEVMTACIQKCFASVKEVLTSVEGDDTYLVGIISNEGEEFRASARAKVRIGESIDNAIKAIEGMFRDGLKSRIKSFVSEYASESKTRVELIASNLYQASMVGEALIFTSNTEIVLDEDENYEDNMGQYFQEQCTAYMDAGKLLTQSLVPAAAGAGLDSLRRPDATLPHSASLPHGAIINDAKRMALTALIVQYVHCRDVVDFLARNDVHGVNNFYWQMQLRYYQPDSPIIKQLDAVFEYGYEYLGVRNPSPVTPTVERCWVSYTSALRNKYWSTVVGPPDHGKFSTIQDLAAALGKFCYLYVCTPDATTRTMEKLLIAAVSSSCWLVFENANVLQYGVLSSLAHRLYTLRQALHEENKGEWHPPGSKPIQVVPKTAAQGVYAPYFGIFLLVDNMSMRKIQVPHSIKSMFRPVAVTTVELAAVAESWLYSFGFKEGQLLGCKLEKFFATAQDLMTIEGFSCDFGLRTLQSIIKIAAALRFDQPDSKSESRLILSAIKSLYKSRLAEPALVTIEKVARMVFAEGEIDEVLLKKTDIPLAIIQEASKNMMLSFDTDIAPKLNELNAAFAKRTACVLVGDATCGKTKTLELLRECYRLMFATENEKSEMVTLFQKGFTKSELYGMYDARCWVEGILAGNLLRLSRLGNKKCYNFLHCDGPLDPEWVEQLQGAFEEEKKVTLANGDSIEVSNMTKVIFEVDNLREASPATISRAAVVYLQRDAVMPRNIVDNWLKQLPGKIRSFDMVKEPLETQINSLLYSGFVSRALIPKLKEEKIILSDNSIALTFCSLFEAIYTMLEPSAEEKKEKAEEKIKKLVGKVVVFALAWAFGGSLSQTKLKKIDDFIEEGANIGDKPKETSCFDAYVRTRDGPAEFGAWAELAPVFRNPEPTAPPEDPAPFKYSAARAFTQMIVPTKQLIRYKWFIETLAANHKNVLLFGDSGTGKSLITSYSLMQENEEEVQQPVVEGGELAAAAPKIGVGKSAGSKFKKVNLCFTWNTTSARLQDSLEDRLEKKRKNLYSAPTLKKAVIYIDDVNLPKADKYGTIPVLECLRGIVEKSGYFDRSRYFWKRLSKTSFLCSASPAYGGRKELSERFLRHFNVFYMNTMAYQDMRSLFETVIMAHFLDFSREYNVAKSGFLECILDIHDLVSQKLPGNPRNPHYLLSYKDAGKLLSGVLLGKKEPAISPDVYGKLLIHEAVRVYRDRYTCVEDREAFNKEVNKLIEKHLNAKWKLEPSKDLMFTSIRAPEAGQYAEIKDWNEIKQALEEKQDQYNKELESVDQAKISLVFFKEAVEYIVKVARILSIPRSHMINLGPQALGRRSLLEITTYLYDCDLITADYNMRDFSGSLKRRYENVKASLEKAITGEFKGVVFMAKVGESHVETEEGHKAKILEEYERNTDTVLDDMYQLLSTGDLRHVDQDLKCADVRDYLHLILSMPNCAADIRRKMRMYPGLFSECHLVYQEQWPTEAAVSIAAAQLAKEPEDIRTRVPEIIVKMHRAVEAEVKRAWAEERRKVLVAPSQGKEIAKTFVTFYEQKSQELAKAKTEVLRAIENVEQSKNVEKECQDENTQKKPDSEKKKLETDELFAKCRDLEYCSCSQFA